MRFNSGNTSRIRAPQKYNGSLGPGRSALRTLTRRRATNLIMMPLMSLLPNMAPRGVWGMALRLVVSPAICLAWRQDPCPPKGLARRIG
jgi:hypothetical protein